MEKKCSLAEMVKKAFTAATDFRCVYSFRVTFEGTHVYTCLKWTATSQAIWFIARHPPINGLPHIAVTLIIVDWCNRSIDRDLMEVRTTQSNQLCVQVRK